MSEQDGGPAYPFALHTPGQGGFVTGEELDLGGLSVRDYFAAQALNAVLRTAPEDASPAACAMWAYSVADAMLAERAK